MKAVFEKLSRNIGYILSFVFPYKLFNKYVQIRNLVFSGYIKTQFKHVGSNFSVESPMRIYGSKYTQIGDNFIAGARLRIEAYDRFLNSSFQPQIVIGNNVNINFDCHIGCINQIHIGDDVLIASKVLIIDHFHGEITLAQIKQAPLQRPLTSKGPIRIGNNVWIGEGSVIMPGVEIGENSIIGGNSVVTKSFAANCVIGGNPARLIKHLE